MASADPNDPNDNDYYEDPPKTPALKLKEEGLTPLAPDTEDHVAEETDVVFRNFVYLMYTNSQQDEQAVEETPCSVELTAFHDDPFGPTWQVGRQLAMIGDDINDRYTPQFNNMIRMLQITPDTAYEAFAGVARKLFHGGRINWGRVITLLCFGYRMAVTVLQRGIRGFFSKIIGFVCKFILVEKIAQWIAEQGGWRAVLNYIPESVGYPVIAMVLGLAAFSVLATIYIRKQT